MMDWARNTDWPHAATSEFILCKPHKWHVQIAGDGPTILLLHGAGGATQSWRHLFPLLSKSHRVIAIDLPGQGFTKLGAQQRCGLPEMAEDIAKLCTAQGWITDAIIGHSAGAAIALEMTAHLKHTPKIIGINAALDTFKGIAGVMFPVLAKTLAMVPMVAEIFTATATRGQGVQKLINGTGSKLSAGETMFYQRLFEDRQHVNATLQMMAQWDLAPLIARLPQIKNDTLLMAGQGDMMVPCDVSQMAARQMPNATFVAFPDLGHLAHEEAPEIVAKVAVNFVSA